MRIKAPFMLRIPSFIRFGLALNNSESIVKAWISLPLPKFMAETSKEGDGCLRINHSTRFRKANRNINEIEYTTFTQGSHPFAK